MLLQALPSECKCQRAKKHRLNFHDDEMTKQQNNSSGT
jgi:hypothetical protein